MTRIILQFCFLILFSQICFSQAYWEGSEYIADGVRQPLVIHSTKEEAETLKSRWTTIGDEINSTNNLAAGTYERSGYRGYYLRFAPNSGFVFIYHLEDLDVIDYSFGKIEVKGSEVTFITEREIKEKGRDNKPMTTPLNWIVFGTTLVEENDIKNYADYLSGLGDFNNWNCECMAFFHKSYKDKSPEYLIPQKYKSLFRPAINGEITFVGKESLHRREKFVPVIETQVQINVGEKQGVKKGMIFRFHVGKDVERELTVIRVSNQSSLALITDGIFSEDKGLFATYYDSESKTEKRMPETEVGTKISTQLFPWTYGEN